MMVYLCVEKQLHYDKEGVNCFKKDENHVRGWN